jgi:hypothetical protein
MADDRRNQRSENPIEAAELYLTAAAKRRSFQALTLSGPDGAILADAPTALNSEALATIARIAGPGDHETDGLVNLITRGQPLRVWDLEIEGSRHYVSAVGVDDNAQSEAEQALRRILC